jgi:hypothetical protein
MVVTIVSTEMDEGTSDDDWIAEHIPVRYERSPVDGRECPRVANLTNEPKGIWEATRIAGFAAQVRGSCGFVDGVVTAGGRAYVITVEGPADWTATEAAIETFDTFTSALELHPDEARCVTHPQVVGCLTIPAQMTVPFASERYGYSLLRPATPDCIPTPAEWGWLPPTTYDADMRLARWDDPSVSDRICGNPFSYTGVSAEVPAGLAGDAWLAEHVAPRTERHFLGPCDGLASTDWSPRSVGRDWLVRSDCGSLDAVAFADGRAYVFAMSYETDRYDVIRAWLEFDALLATVAVPDSDASPIGPLTESFTSTRYGYSIALPEDWDSEPASRSWTPGVRPASEELDRFDPDDAAAARPKFTVMSVDLPDGAEEVDWLEGALPSRVQRVGGGLARCGGRIASYTNEWSDPRAIGPHLVRVREACGFIDGALFVGHRVYVFSAEGAVTFEGPDPSTRLVFEVLVAAFEPWPTFTSARYGYSLQHPTDWVASAATTPWTGSGTWWETPSADVLDGPNTSPYPEAPWFAVVATDVPPGTTAPAWAAEHVPVRPQLEQTSDGHQHCTFRGGGGTMWVETGWDSAWQDGTIDGRPARIRASCGFVDAVVIVGSRAYVISMFTKRDGARNTRDFEAFVGRLHLDAPDA